MGQGVRRTIVRGLVAGVAALALSGGAAPASAQAEANYWPWCSQGDRVCVEGPQVSGHSGSEFCEWDFNGTAHPNAAACVDKANDIVWVKDTAEDGRSGMANVLGSGGTWYHCRNKHGNGSWARCNFDWPENRSFDLYLQDWNFSAGVGSELYWVRAFND